MKSIPVILTLLFTCATLPAGAQDLRSRTSAVTPADAAAAPAATATPAAEAPAAEPAAVPAPAAPAVTPAPVPAKLTNPFEQPEPRSKTPAVQTLLGFAIVPTNTWKSGQFVSYHDYLSLDFDQSSLSTYEGSLWHNKTGLKVGASADVDNNMVGKLNRFMGFIGYKKFVLRVQNSKLRGTATWTGLRPGDMPATMKFDNKYTNIDLLYWSSPKKGVVGSPENPIGGFYYGLGYNSYSMPVQVNAELYSPSRNDIVYGNAVYQDDAEYKIYTAMFGFDTLAAAAMSDAKGFGFWATSQDKIGAGALKISADAAHWLAENNPGTTISNRSLTAIAVDYDVTMGAMWSGDLKAATLSVGLGYNFGGQVDFSFGGGDILGKKDTAHVRADPFPYLMHYGPILKAMVKW